MPKNLGPISGDPDIPTKKYVDDAVAARLTQAQGDAAYVNVTGDTMTGRLTGPETMARAHTVWRTGEPRQNLGDPTVYEAALFETQASNKTWFYERNQVVYEYTMDGTSWVVHDVSKVLHDRVWAGSAVADASNISIPNGCAEYRITVRNNGAYVYLSDLYMYGSPGQHRFRMQVQKKRDDGSWIDHTALSDELSGWPAHYHAPHGVIPWSLAATNGHYNDVRIRFVPRWVTGGSYDSMNIAVYAVEWWGGYPAGRRSIYSYDSTKAVAFPSTVSVATPSASAHAATKQYVDDAVASRLTPAQGDAAYVNVTGDTMTGSLGMGSNRIWNLGNPTNADHATTKEYVDSRSPKTVVLAPGESVPPGLEGGSVVVTGAQTPRFVASSGAYSTATTTSISIPPSPLARAGDTCIVVVSSDNAGAYTVDIPGMSPLLPPFVSGNQYTNVLYRTWSDSSTLAGTLSQLRSFNASAWWLRDGVLGTPGSVGIRSATSFSVTAPQTTTTGAGRVFAIFGARTIAATAAENDPTLSLTWGSVDDVQWGDSTLSSSTAISRLWLVSMPSSGGGLVPDNTATMLDNSGNAFGFLIPYYSGSTPVYLPTVDEVIRQIDYGPRVSGKGSISSTSATTGISTKLNLALTSGSGVTVASNAITVTKAGWYMIHYMLHMTGAVGTPVRIFQEIQINSEVVARTSRGVNEDRHSLSALCWMDTTSPAVFNFYQITGATVTVSGSWSLKYLGSA